MIKRDLKVDVSSAVPLAGPLEVVLTVYLPDQHPRSTSPAIVVFALPGGGYSRGYFDMEFPGHQDYSQARHHTDAGLIFIAADHLGVGDSSQPDPATLTMEMIAQANDVAFTQVLTWLKTGELDEHFPPVKNPFSIGIGQSMGGCITLLMQARHHTYDAVGILGYSALHTQLPQPDAGAWQRARAGHEYSRESNLSDISVAATSQTVTDFRFPFHWEDVPEVIVQADMGGGYPLRQTAPPFGSLTVPPCAVQMMSPGCVKAEAAAIDVPVFIGVGERDVCPDPRMEPSAYVNARDISLVIVPSMAHMHNFAATRKLLWARLVAWSRWLSQRETGSDER